MWKFNEHLNAKQFQTVLGTVLELWEQCWTSSVES